LYRAEANLGIGVLYIINYKVVTAVTQPHYSSLYAVYVA